MQIEPAPADRAGDGSDPASGARAFRRTLDVLDDLMARTRAGKETSLHFSNPELQPCWQLLSCTSVNCPCHGRPAMRCWQVVGTHCGGQVTGSFAQKLDRCERCEPYRRATVQPAHRAAETLLNLIGLIQSREAELARIRAAAAEADNVRSTVEHFHRLMQRVRESGDLNVEMENPHMRACWEVKACTRTACPCHEQPPMRCWQRVGTHCGGVVQGAFAQKVCCCENCEVYSLATPTPTWVIGETFQNLMLIIRQKQDDLVQARIAAEAGERVKSAFLANMSHEMRTPLNGVLGFLQLLEQTQLDTEQREYVKIVSQSGGTLLAMINNILEFSNMEAGHLELEQTDFDMCAAVESVAEQFASQAREKGLKLASRVRPDVPGRLRGDPIRIKQVLSNRVSNAVKFTETGEVAIDVASEPGVGEETMLRVEVRDTGIGIPADRIKMLFHSFTQADSSMTRRFGGTGLGLVIARRLVDLMGGKIDVESEPGRGSKFTFTVKLARTVPPSLSPDFSPPAPT